MKFVVSRTKLFI